MTIRQQVNKRLRKKNNDSLESWIIFWRNGFPLPQQKIFFQNARVDSFDEGQAASVPKQVLQLRGATDLNVQAGDTFEYHKQQWQIIDDPLVSESSVAVRVMARRMQ